MIIVGKRQSGKTTYAINEIARRCKDGYVVGVMSFSQSSSERLKKELDSRLKKEGKSVITRIINFEDIKDVSLVLIDCLDIILGDKCICAATNNIVNLISEKYVESELAYKEVHNVVKDSKQIEGTSNLNILKDKLGVDISTANYGELIDVAHNLRELSEAIKQYAESLRTLEIYFNK